MIATRTLGAIAALGAAATIALGCAPAPAPGPPAPPATIVVTTTADVVDNADGLTSLREAFTAAANDNADSTVVVSSGAEYALTRCTGQPALVHGGARALTVTTDGAARATVRQTCSPGRVMSVGGSTVTLERLVVTGGRLQSPLPCGISIYGQPDCARGAGIAASGPLVLDDVEVIDNRSIGGGSVEGGGVSARNGATIIDSEFTSNAANRAGGALASFGPVTITGSTFTSNIGGDGGALSIHDGSVTIEQSAFVGNGNGSGGAIVLVGASLSATDTVFRQNNSGGGPGAAI